MQKRAQDLQRPPAAATSEDVPMAGNMGERRLVFGVRCMIRCWSLDFESHAGIGVVVACATRALIQRSRGLVLPACSCIRLLFFSATEVL